MNIKFYIRKLRSTDLSRFKDTAKAVSKIDGRPWRLVLLDIYWCAVVYGAGHVDYKEYEMYGMNHKQRKGVLTSKKNNILVKKYTDFDYVPYYKNKALLYNKFGDFLKRDWMILGEDTVVAVPDGKAVKDEDIPKGQGLEAFKKFISDKEDFIVKPLDLSCGKGVEKIHTADWDPEELYNTLLANRQFLVEELVVQCEEMCRLSKAAVNTVRIMTILDKGEAKAVGGCVRMGTGDNVVDNFNHDGISACLDVKTGTIMTIGYDKKRNFYETVPGIGTEIKGFQVPCWDEIIEFVKAGSLVMPQVKYLGWDLCVSKDKGIVMIECNHYPGHDCAQYPKLNLGTYDAIMEALR
ncbi:MAG: hypothetical protein MJ171_03745 [Clostridia bacterium]|nr:hypothetical protein [Clostridia bacterium]